MSNDKPYDIEKPDEKNYPYDYQKSQLAVDKEKYDKLIADIADLGNDYASISEAYDKCINEIVEKNNLVNASNTSEENSKIQELLDIMNNNMNKNIPYFDLSGNAEIPDAIKKTPVSNLQTLLDSFNTNKNTDNYKDILKKLLIKKKAVKTASTISDAAIMIVRAFIINYIRDVLHEDLRNNWEIRGETRIEYGGKSKKSKKSKTRKSKKSKTRKSKKSKTRKSKKL